MSPSTLDSAEAQWQTQLAVMRAALADLKLPSKSSVDELPYGSDIEYEEDDEMTSGNSGDDVWDFISETEDEISTSDAYEESSLPQTISLSYGTQWLEDRCAALAGKRDGLSSDDLQGQIMALLISDSGEEELQSTLTDIIGFDDLDFLIELVSHRNEITAAQSSAPKKDDGLFGKIQTKREREEALRQRDYEHKHAALGPRLVRDETEYPHVYKAHSAGNTLDSRGKKYALPMGSERTEHMVSYLNRYLYPLVLMKQRDTRSIQFQPVKLGHLAKDES